METGALIVKSGWRRSLQRFGTLLLDQLYPPVCLACDKPVATADTICSACFRALRPITAPLCPILGLPFEVSLGPDAVSAEAIAHPPNFERARSAVVYNAIARSLVGKLKYGDRPELARFCARLMALSGHELWGPDAVLVPVPLHRSRQFSRRYNQSTELARALGKLTALPVEPGLVIRKRNTRHQVGLTADGRRRNVAGAFAAHPDIALRLKGRRVILVDDVITTGSTVTAVTKALKSGGAERVDVVSFARVVVGPDYG